MSDLIVVNKEGCTSHTQIASEILAELRKKHGERNFLTANFSPLFLVCVGKINLLMMRELTSLLFTNKSIKLWSDWTTPVGWDGFLEETTLETRIPNFEDQGSALAYSRHVLGLQQGPRVIVVV